MLEDKGHIVIFNNKDNNKRVELLEHSFICDDELLNPLPEEILHAKILNLNEFREYERRKKQMNLSRIEKIELDKFYFLKSIGLDNLNEELIKTFTVLIFQNCPI